MSERVARPTKKTKVTAPGRFKSLVKQLSDPGDVAAAPELAAKSGKKKYGASRFKKGSK